MCVILVEGGICPSGEVGLPSVERREARALPDAVCQR